MRQTKYIISGGLAFTEEKDMEKLRRYSLKGWHASDFKFMGYTLEKGESTEYIYSVDYRSLEEDEEEEYFDFFSSAGWSHITSEANIHLFRAPPNTKPIYSDRDTTVEKYETLSGSIKKLVIPFVLITALVWGGAMISYGTLESLLQIIAVILSVIAIPIALTAVASYTNKWKVEGRRGLVNLVKVILLLLLLIPVMILFFVDGVGATVTLLKIMIGAIAFPTAIWLLMSFYHNFARKRGPN